ncbi:DUF4062 domain-containing protein [Acinetobacter rudis]|uniref:DUF4062 domain-containing protein n=1 Tax=Acinetobacter rudis TaxID=632955 RepID=UPI00280E25A0|nr:DUF4062 domain-containing protein [Acinetobacter rudis]MDQ8952722.1 DUF4062 domain-containing protein [Acinetobacter rudis]
MLDRRYQVFLITSGKDMQPEREVVMQTLMGMGFFIWGLESRSALGRAYSRRQIEDCDYVLLLLGSQYGELSASGIGYMHLEYIYAVTKQKPIIVLMHDQPFERAIELQDSDIELQQKFRSFRHQLLKEVDHVVLYRELRDLESLARRHMPKLIEHHPTIGWVRPQSLQVFQDEIDHLKVKLAQARMEREDEVFDSFSSLPVVSVDELFSFEYHMHAYQTNYIQELAMTRQLTWGALLQILSGVFRQAQAETLFSIVINDYLKQQALQDAQAEIPQVHTVAQVQVHSRALRSIKQQMYRNDWITPVGRDDRQRKLWKITNKGLLLVREMTCV